MIFVNEFFATARERYQIKLNRDAGKPWPWTHDPVFQEWRFCHVHRENDKTTVWFRENVRNKLLGYDVVAATIIFRWFNRIETGEKILDLLLQPSYWKADEARERLKDVSPVVTGAYIVKGMDGLSKLDGILYVIDIALKRLQNETPPWDIYNHLNSNVSLQAAWKYLCEFYYLGGFMAYEIVTDLRWTHVLEKAPDIMTWANLGPGATRGMGYITDNNPQMFNRGSKTDQIRMLGYMKEILSMSQDSEYWPQEWPSWEMREVEHWLCEHAKYCNALRGDRLKRRFQQ